MANRLRGDAWHKSHDGKHQTEAWYASFRTPEYRARRSAIASRPRTHGHSNSPTYQSWKSMRQRCTNPKRPKYEYYGGRGITYDPRWDDFAAFLADMGERPAGATIDRIDSDGNYTKDNCRWAPWTEQVANQRHHNQLTGVPLPERSGCTEPGCTSLARRLRGPGLCAWHIQKAYRIRRLQRAAPG